MRVVAAAVSVGMVVSAFAVAAAPATEANPSARDPARFAEPLGISALRPERLRSPAGFLYPYPWALERTASRSGESKHWISLELAGTVGAGAEREARFERYADRDDQAALEFLRLGAFDPGRSLLVEALGGGLGREDGFAEVDARRLGWLRVRGFWKGTPVPLARDARILFRGNGSDRLRLPPGLAPGANGDVALQAAFAPLDERTLSFQRHEAGLEVEALPVPALRLYGTYGLTRRDGERPFSGAFLFENGPEPARVVEISQPIDEWTHRVAAGLESNGERWQWRAGYEGSFFRNRFRDVTFENPFALPGVSSGPIERGRLALAPDNDWHRVHVESALALPGRVHASASIAWSRARQDQALLAPTVNDVVVGIPGLNELDLDLWNDADGERADAQRDQLDVRGRLAWRPHRRVRVEARVRYEDEDNDTRYTARNPVTGQIGYVALDGAFEAGTPFARVFTAGVAGEDWRYRASDYARDRLEAGATVRWSPVAATRLEAGYTRDRSLRTSRERRRTETDRFRTAVSTRLAGLATLRVSYEFADRTGSRYDASPNEGDFVSSLPGFVSLFGFVPPRNLADLRISDLGDRRRHDLPLNL